MSGDGGIIFNLSTVYDVMTTELSNSSLSNSSALCEPLASFESTPYKAISVISSLIGLLSLISSSGVVFGILCLKKYRVFHQQLTLQLAVASIAHSLVYTVDLVDLYKDRDLTTHYCSILGFLQLYTSWVELLSIVSITFNLIFLSFYEKQVEKLLSCHILLVFLLPLLWCWVPFTVGAFGVRGPWCGIRVHGSTCEVFLAGTILRFVLWQIPVYVFALPVFIVSSIAVFVKFKRRTEKWRGPCHKPEAMKGRYKIFREIKPLLLFPLIYMLLKLSLLVSQLYEAIDPLNPAITLWILEAIFSPLAGAAIAVMYGLDPQTRTKLRTCQIKSLCQNCCALSCTCVRCKPRRTPQVAAYNVELHETYGDSVEGEAARIKANYTRRMMELSSL